MHRSCVSIVCAVLAVAASAGLALAATVAGGGSPSSDCALVLEVPGANKPALPRAPKAVDCVDGSDCDSDGLRNGECVFSLQLCVNSSALDACTGDTTSSIVVDHAVDDGMDRRFDTDFQALQTRATGLGLPTSVPDKCTLSSSITVKLRGPDSSNVMKLNRKILRITTDGTVAAGSAHDVDKMKFTCRPEGNAVYLPIDLYAGTFDRIRKQVFAQTCAVSGCHDSEGNSGNLILLPGAAYSNLVGVTPDNLAAAGDGLKRVTPGDPVMSLLYRKLTGDLPAGYDAAMPKDQPPLDDHLIEIIRLWILGDMTNGQAPATGWVPGTDQ
jgi:hypothetical protein